MPSLLPSTSPAEIGAWLMCAAAVAVIADRLFSFYKNHLRESPPPSETYARRSECEARHSAGDRVLRELTDKMQADIRLLQTHREADAAAAGESRRTMYERLQQLQTNTSAEFTAVRRELTTNVQLLERSLGRVEGKVDGIAANLDTLIASSQNK